MKVNTKHPPHSLSQIQFQFRAVSAEFKNVYLNKRFRLYLQRQAQIIGEVKTLFSQNNLKENFSFPFDQQIIPFRVLRPTSANYQIALYQIDLYDNQTFLEAVQLSICKYVQDYQKQLLKCEEQLWSQVKSDEKTSVAEIWRALSNNFTKKTLTSLIRFHKIQVLLEVRINATNKYDKQVKKDDQVQKKRREDKLNMKKKAEFGKSKTLPSLPQLLLPSLEQKLLEGQQQLFKKLKTLEPDIRRSETPQRQESNLITSLSIPSLNFHLSKIQEVEEYVQENQKQKQLPKSERQSLDLKQSLDITPANPQLKQQPQCIKANQKRLETEGSQYYAINTAQGTRPEIDIKAFKLIPTHEVINTLQNVSQLGKDQDVQQPPLAKVDSKNLLTWIVLIGLIVVIYWLMQPMSKI